MNDAGYSIFSHAQLGHNDRTDHTHTQHVISSTDQVAALPPDESVSSKFMKPRARPERGWSVEMGLGLGPTFNRTRKTK